MAGMITITLQETNDVKYTLTISRELSTLIENYITDHNNRFPNDPIPDKFSLFLRIVWDDFLGKILEGNSQTYMGDGKNPDLLNLKGEIDSIVANIENLKNQKESLLKYKIFNPRVSAT